MINKIVLGLFIVLGQFSSDASAEFRLLIEGSSVEGKAILVEQKLTLLEVLTRAELTDQTFLYGASWTQPQRKPFQLQLKTELLYILQQLINATSSEEALDYFKGLQSLIRLQKVTGRVFGIDFDLFHVEMLPLKNRAIISESFFYFPKQPKTLNLIGFSEQKIEFNSSLSLNTIIAQQKKCSVCQAGWLWVVQPNTLIEKVKVGLWTNQEHYAAPGAWVIAPLATKYYQEDFPDFYFKLSYWLALQVVR